MPLTEQDKQQITANIPTLPGEFTAPGRQAPEPVESGPDFWNNVDAARKLHGVDFAVLDKVLEMMAPEYDPEPGFKFDDKTWRDVTQGVATQHLDAFSGVESTEEAHSVRWKILREQELHAQLGEAGWGGIGATAVAALMDPITVGAALLSGGMATPWLFAPKSTRLAGAIRAAGAGAAFEGTLETISVSERETKGAQDVLWAAALGGALSAPFGALARPWDQELADASARIASRITEDQAVEAVARAFDRPMDVTTGAAGRRTELLSLARQQMDDSREYRALNGKLKRLTEDGDRLRAQRDTDYLLGKYGDEIRKAEAKRSAAPESRNAVASRSPTGVTKGTARDADLDRIYRALTPERVKPMGRKESAKVQSRIDKTLQADLKERSFRLAEIDQQRSALSGRVDELRALVEGRTHLMINKRAERLPDVKANAERMLPGKPAPEAAPIARTSDDSIGAARVQGSAVSESFSKPHTVADEAQEAQPAAFGQARISMTGRLLNSESPVSQWFARTFLSDPVAGDSGRNLLGQQKRDVQIQTESAVELQDRLFLVQANSFVDKAVNQAWAGHARAQGYGKLRTAFASKQRREFFEGVTEVIRDMDAGGVSRSGAEVSPEMMQAVKAVQDTHAEILQIAKNVGVAGFDTIDEAKNYIHRAHLKSKYREVDEKYGTQALLQLLETSLLRRNPDMDPTVATAIAKAFRNRFTNPSKDVDGLNFSMGIHARDVDQVERALREGTDLDSAEVDNVLGYLRAADSRDGKAGRDVGYAKRRIDLDETTSIEVPGIGTLRFADLTENNAEMLTMRYLRTMTGHIAVAHKLKPGLIAQHGADYVRHGVRTDLEMDKIILEASNTGASAGDLKRMRMAYNMLTGRPPTDSVDSTWGHVSRFVRDWNFLRLMGQTGAAQIAELGTIMGQVGIAIAGKNLGMVRHLMKDARNGKMKEPMLRELEEFGVVFGVERNIMQPVYRLEDYGLESMRANNILNKADIGIQHMKRALGDLSGMSGMTIVLQRMAGISAAQRFLKMANKGQMDRTRMRSLGLSDEIQDRIMGQIRTHSGKETMESGRQADVLNLERWDDAESRQAFVAAMHRWGSRMVQRNLIGDMPAWMHTPMGQLAGQFRSFVMTAYEKQLLQGLNMADFQTVMTFTWSMAFGGAAYVAQTQLNSIGREDRDEYLRERLNAKQIGMSAFQRAGFASILPGLIDSANTFNPMLDEGIFSYGRSTGLATNFITGNPTFSLLITDLPKLVGSEVRAPFRDDYELSHGDIKAAFGVVPFGNTWMMRNFEAMAAEGNPYKNTAEPRTLDQYLGLE